MLESDIAKVVHAAERLRLEPRGDRWCHLSLCVIDAVFSIGARYGSTWRAARRYAEHAALAPVAAPAHVIAEGRVGKQQSLEDFLVDIGHLSGDEFAALLANRQQTSTRGGILKAAAAQQIATILAEHNVQGLEDVATVLSDHQRTKAVEKALARVRGHGSGVRTSYLWMLAGDDHHVKADRMVIRWLERVLGRPVSPQEASTIVVDAAAVLEVAPWVLDHAIWRRQSRRTAAAV